MAELPGLGFIPVAAPRDQKFDFILIRQDYKLLKYPLSLEDSIFVGRAYGREYSNREKIQKKAGSRKVRSISR